MLASQNHFIPFIRVHPCYPWFPQTSGSLLGLRSGFVQATALVFLATAARARIVSSDLGRNGNERGPQVPFVFRELQPTVQGLQE